MANKQQKQAKPTAPDRLRQVVMNAETGEILLDKGANTPHDPASLNKMMTAYKAYEQVAAGKAKWTDMVTLSSRAADMNPNTFKAADFPDNKLPAGTKLPLGKAVELMMATSHNGFAAAIGEHLTTKLDKKGRPIPGSGSESRFGKEMTETARKLGMADTTFANASGYNNVRSTSTAKDMAILSMKMMKNFPESESRVNSRGTNAVAKLPDGSSYKIPYQPSIVRTGNMYQKGYNSFAAVGPQKTGTNPRTAGYNLATAVETKNGIRLIVVTLGATSNEARYKATDKILREAVAKTHDPAAPAGFHIAYQDTKPSEGAMLAMKEEKTAGRRPEFAQEDSSPKAVFGKRSRKPALAAEPAKPAASSVGEISQADIDTPTATEGFNTVAATSFDTAAPVVDMGGLTRVNFDVPEVSASMETHPTAPAANRASYKRIPKRRRNPAPTIRA